jgi:hypothetical protein
MAMTSTPRYVLATYVKEGRDDDFERFMREVVAPADVQARPHLVGKWQLLRPAADQPEGATRAWLMFFEGPAALDDWNLEPSSRRRTGSTSHANSCSTSKTWSKANRLSTRSTASPDYEATGLLQSTAGLTLSPSPQPASFRRESIATDGWGVAPCSDCGPDSAPLVGAPQAHVRPVSRRRSKACRRGLERGRPAVATARTSPRTLH